MKQPQGIMSALYMCMLRKYIPASAFRQTISMACLARLLKWSVLQVSGIQVLCVCAALFEKPLGYYDLSCVGLVYGNNIPLRLAGGYTYFHGLWLCYVLLYISQIR